MSNFSFLHMNRTKKPQGRFIDYGQFDPKNPAIHDIYTMVYGQPVNDAIIAKLNLGENHSELLKYSSKKLNDAIAQLYQIPVIRKTYGDDLTHGMRTSCSDQVVQFINIDDSGECYAYMRELTKFLEQHLMVLLEKKDFYLFYAGDHIEILEGKEAKRKKFGIDGRIAWVEP